MKPENFRKKSDEDYRILEKKFILSHLISLCNAVIDRNKERVLFILQHGNFDLKSVNGNGDTMLHFIVGHVESLQNDIAEILKIFIDRGVDPNIKNTQEITVMHIAVKRKLKDIVEFLLKHNSNIYVTDTEGNSIAHYFVENEFQKLAKYGMNFENVDYVKWLLSKGFGFDLKNRKGQSALHLAMVYNMQHILPTLLAHTCDVNFKSQHGNQTLLQLFLNASNAATAEFIYGIKNFGKIQGLDNRATRPLPSKGFPKSFAAEIVKILLERGVSVDHVDEQGFTALYVAVNAEEQVDVIEMLLDRFTKVKEKCGDQLLRRVIEKATRIRASHAIHAQYKILRSLLAKGADVNRKDGRGMTPLSRAVECQSRKLVELMSDYATANFSVSTRDGDNLLHVLAKNNYNEKPSVQDQVDLFDILVRENCDVNARNNEGQTPLHVALRNRSSVVARKLVERGADVNRRERQTGWYPLHIAVYRDSLEAVKLLLESGARVNGRSRLRETALHLSVNASRTSILETLLAHRAEVNARDRRGDSALVRALYVACAASVRLLLEHGADVNDVGLTRLCARYWKHIANEIALRHWIELEIAEEYAFVRDEDSLRGRECARSEIEILKSTRVDSRASLYAWLRMDPNRRWMYSRDRNVRELVESPVLRRQFPRYSTTILGCYRESLARKPLLEPAKDAWLRLTEKYLPDVCLQRILSYLNTGDLFEMAEIFP